MNSVHQADERQTPVVVIRAAAQEDSRLIRRLVRAGGLPPFSLRWQHFLIAEMDGQAVGCGQIRRHEKTRELGSLVVLPEFRRQGIAAQLIAALEQQAGYPLFLFCRDAMESYYARFGFRRTDYQELPRDLKWQAWLGFNVMPLFGIRIIAMRKEQT